MMIRTERDNCHFSATTTPDGNPAIKMVTFHDSISSLSGASLNFELRSGTTYQNAKKLAEFMNEWIRGVWLMTP
jgi:hypothetical protein